MMKSVAVTECISLTWQCVIAELKESKLKPLKACTRPWIGVIETDAILIARIYQ